MKRAHHIRFAGKKIEIQCEPESCTFKSSLFVSMYLAMFSCSDISLSGILNSDIRYQISSLARYQGYPDLVQVSCYLPTPVPIGKVHDRRSTKSEHFVIIIVIIIVIVIILFFSFNVLPDTSPSLHLSLIHI